MACIHCIFLFIVDHRRQSFASIFHRFSYMSITWSAVGVDDGMAMAAWPGGENNAFDMAARLTSIRSSVYLPVHLFAAHLAIVVDHRQADLLYRYPTVHLFCGRVQ